MTRHPSKPLVLRALALLDLTDSDVARLLGVTPGAVCHWTQGRKPIPPATHSGLWYLVLALTQDVADARTARALKAAASAALSDAPDAATLKAGSRLALTLVGRLSAQAKSERAAVRAAAERLA